MKVRELIDTWHINTDVPVYIFPTDGKYINHDIGKGIETTGLYAQKNSFEYEDWEVFYWGVVIDATTEIETLKIWVKEQKCTTK